MTKEVDSVDRVDGKKEPAGRRRYGGQWVAVVVFLVAGALVGAIGANPRYIEELRIGGGYGESVDGGIDFEDDGTLLTDGSITTDGDVNVLGGDVVGTTDGTLTIKADTNIIIQLDADNDGTCNEYVKNGAGSTIFTREEDGDMEGTISKNGAMQWQAHNTSSGASAASVFAACNAAASTSGMRVIAFGTGWTTAGAYIQDAGALDASTDLSGGMSIVAAHASGDVRIYAGGSASGNKGLTIDHTNDVTAEDDVEVKGAFHTSTVTTFTGDDTTPSVGAGNVFRTPDSGWTASTNITMFDDGQTGQVIMIIAGADADCVVTDGGNLVLAGNWTATNAGDTLSLVFGGTNWYELSRSANS